LTKKELSMSHLIKNLNSNYIRNHIKIITLAGLLYLLGALSGFMFLIFLFTGSYTVVDFGLRTQTALLLNAFLSLLFFLQHSIMVRKRFKAWLGKFIPEFYHNALYGITSAFTLILVLLLWQKVFVFIMSADGIFYWMLRALFLLCLVGFGWGATALGSFDALGVKPLMNYIANRPNKPQQIVAKGPYRWSRHPLYFFLIVIIWACPVLTPDRFLFNAMWSIWIIIGTFLEDRDLHKEFGSQYLEYSSRVPMLIPYRIPKK